MSCEVFASVRGKRILGPRPKSKLGKRGQARDTILRKGDELCQGSRGCAKHTAVEVVQSFQALLCSKQAARNG
jgi:hypothetical protein